MILLRSDTQTVHDWTRFYKICSYGAKANSSNIPSVLVYFLLDDSTHQEKEDDTQGAGDTHREGDQDKVSEFIWI